MDTYDVGFDIMIPVETVISGITFRQREVEWGGEKHVDGPFKATFGPNFDLTLTDIGTDRKLLIMEPYYSREWQTMLVGGEGLNLYYRCLQQKKEAATDEEDVLIEPASFGLADLLRTVCREKQWIIFFEPQFDTEIEIRKAGTLSEVIGHISDALLVREKGFAIWGEGTDI